MNWIESVTNVSNSLNRQLFIAIVFVLVNVYQNQGVPFSRHDIYTNIKAGKTFPTYLEQPSTCKVNHVLSDFLVSDIEIGWENKTQGAADWLRVMCPEVVEHFDRFPIFSANRSFLGVHLPISTTDFAAQAVCTTKVVQLLAHSVQARVYLHAGSHLGAMIHGSPIPWDDDVSSLLADHLFSSLLNFNFMQI